MKFGGLPTDGDPISALCSNGIILKNYYGTWLVNFVVVNANFTTMVMHPTYNKAQRYVGQSGVGYATAYNQQEFISTNATSDLTSMAFVNERTLFAFGLGGACVQGDFTGAITNWTVTCVLPGMVYNGYYSIQLVLKCVLTYFRRRDRCVCSCWCD